METVVILHSLAISVEQLCARSAGAPSVEELRPRFCAECGQLARDGGRVRVQGHGCYSRQVCGLSEGWIVVWVRRYLCRDCGHTMSRLPDWLHPWRWYAAAVIVEALYRHLILGETARWIGVRFGRSGEASEWRSLRRWRTQMAHPVVGVADIVGLLGSRLGNLLIPTCVVAGMFSAANRQLHAVGKCPRKPTERIWSFRWEYFCSECRAC